ncbi:MAG: hypothetical protein WCR02_07425 [Sphaerochaetaceae bacterium]
MDIHLFICFGGNKVNLTVIDFTYGNIIASSKKLKENNVLKYVIIVSIAKAKKVVAKSNIDYVVLTKGSKIFLTFDIKSFDFIEEVAFKKCVT